MTTLVLVFKKMESEDKTKYDNFCLSSKAEIIINEKDTENVFKSIYITIMTNIQKSLGKGSGWIIDSVIDQSVSECNWTRTQNHLFCERTLNHWPVWPNG